MLTYSVESIAHLSEAAGMHATFGRLVFESHSLRVIDLEKSDFKIDIIDPRFVSDQARTIWPFSQSAKFLLGVELQWVLCTVQIRKIVHLSILCPWDGAFNYAPIFTTDEWEAIA